MKKFLARLFRRPQPELVPYHDSATGRAVMIPKAELGPGAVLIHIAGEPHPVYADSAQLKQSDHRHPPFEGDVKEAIESLASDLSSVRPMSYEQWEDGFRRDQNPERELAGWLHLAAILKILSERFAFDDDQRKECYMVLVACYTGDRETVRQRSDPRFLTNEQVNLAVKYFFDGGYR